jgi:hypothetical protein
MRTALAIAATVLLTLALAAGLGIEPENVLADEPHPELLIQRRPISRPVGADGVENLGVWPVPARAR